jgi:hypothetical protein
VLSVGQTGEGGNDSKACEVGGIGEFGKVGGIGTVVKTSSAAFGVAVCGVVFAAFAVSADAAGSLSNVGPPGTVTDA